MTSARASFCFSLPFSRHLCITQHPCLWDPISIHDVMQALKMKWVYFSKISVPSISESSGLTLALKMQRKD